MKNLITGICILQIHFCNTKNTVQKCICTYIADPDEVLSFCKKAVKA